MIHMLRGHSGISKGPLLVSPIRALLRFSNHLPLEILIDEAAELEGRLLGRFDAIRGNGEWVKDLPEVRGAFTTLAPLQAEYRNDRVLASVESS